MNVVRPRWGLVGLGWAAYVFYYLGRVNLSAAVPLLDTERGLDSVEIGLLTAAFFWVYSVGGVVMGRVADRHGTRLLVGLGLVGSAAANGIFGLSRSWLVMLVVWTANGAFQAMGWSPLLGAIPALVPPDKTEKVATIFGSSFVAGSALALLLGGLLVDVGGLTAVFTVPAVLMAAMAGVWWSASRRLGRVVGERAVLGMRAISVMLMRSGGLLPAVGLVGLVYVALLVWVPLYLVQTHAVAVGTAALVSAALIAVGVLGSAVAGWWFGGGPSGHELRRVGVLFATTAASLAAVPVVDSLAWALLTLGIANVLVAACSGIVLAGFAVSAPAGAVATFGGALALIFNLGGGAGGPIVGWVLAGASWSAVFVILAAAMALGVAALVLVPGRGGRVRAATT